MTVKNNQHIFGIILAGGGGTRLWPKSRKDNPKQFLDLHGKKTMLQVTADRFERFMPWERMIVVTNKRYLNLVKQQLPKIPTKNIIVEPEKRDTAMAMLAGAIFAYNLDPKAVLVNDAADHVIFNDDLFVKIMLLAADVASDLKSLVAIGITPTNPSTAFGYIKIGKEIKKLNTRSSLYKVDNFTEKPQLATAQAFIATGKYFWNANHYVWSAQALIDAFKLHMPTMHKQVQPLINCSISEFNKQLPSVYEDVEKISIDYAISEKADNLYLIPGDFGWDDIGEWQVVYNLGKKTPAGNVIISDKENDQVQTLILDSQNNLVHVGDRMVALLGVNDMIVVDTDEILMVAPKSKSQDVKKLVEQLKAEKREQFL